jgi:hypothetical protein
VLVVEVVPDHHLLRALHLLLTTRKENGHG